MSPSFVYPQVYSIVLLSLKKKTLLLGEVNMYSDENNLKKFFNIF